MQLKINIQNSKKMNETAEQTSSFLLQVKAVKLNNENPFTWASGRKSPIYCDNRVTLSYPEIRTFIRQRFVDIINEYYGDVDVIAGVATGGIAQGALVAQELGKPFVYVRSEEKKHGLTSMVAIFTYGLEVAAKNFAEANVELHTLTNYDTLVKVACEQDYVRDHDLESLKTWRENPELWSEQHS